MAVLHFAIGQLKTINVILQIPVYGIIYLNEHSYKKILRKGEIK